MVVIRRIIPEFDSMFCCLSFGVTWPSSLPNTPGKAHSRAPARKILLLHANRQPTESTTTHRRCRRHRPVQQFQQTINDKLFNFNLNFPHGCKFLTLRLDALHRVSVTSMAGNGNWRLAVTAMAATFQSPFIATGGHATQLQ